MIWLFELALVGTGFFLLLMFLNRSGQAYVTEHTEKRVDAYMQTIRRTGEPSALNDMNDSELRDILLASSRRITRYRANRIILLTIVSFATLIVAIFMAANSGLQSFAASIVVGAIAGYGIDRILERNMHAWVERQQLGIDRLTID